MDHSIGFNRARDRHGSRPTGACSRSRSCGASALRRRCSCSRCSSVGSRPVRGVTSWPIRPPVTRCGDRRGPVSSNHVRRCRIASHLRLVAFARPTKSAFWFLVVPFASWLLIMMALVLPRPRGNLDVRMRWNPLSRPPCAECDRLDDDLGAACPGTTSCDRDRGRSAMRERSPDQLTIASAISASRGNRQSIYATMRRRFGAVQQLIRGCGSNDAIMRARHPFAMIR